MNDTLRRFGTLGSALRACFGRRGEGGLISILILIALGLRLYRLDVADLTFDETASAFNAAK